MEFGGITVFATAGHVIQEIDERLTRTDIDVHGFLLGDYFSASPHRLDSISFDYEAAYRHYVFDKTKGDDFGFVVLTPIEQLRLRENNIVPVREINWSKQPDLDDFDAYLMLGVPDEAVTSSRKIDVIGRTILGSAETVMMSLKDVRCTDNKWLSGGIGTMGSLESIKGMSGGPIVGVKETPEGVQYWVIAIQSWWDKQAKQTYACPLRYCGPKMLAALQQINVQR